MGDVYKNRIITIPNLLTLARITVTPFVVFFIIQKTWLTASFLFAFTALTDWIDGFIARRWGMETKLGACLDPIADKILILSILIALWFVSRLPMLVPFWFVAVMVCKELFLIIGASCLWVSKSKLDIKPTSLGKFVMTLQVLLVCWFLICAIFQFYFYYFHTLLLVIVALLSITALVQYVYIGLKQIGWR